MSKYITYYPNGSIYMEELRKDGKRICDNKYHYWYPSGVLPSVKVYDINGERICSIRYHKDGCMWTYTQNVHGSTTFYIEQHYNMYCIYYKNEQDLYVEITFCSDSQDETTYSIRNSNGLHNLHGIAYIKWHTNGKVAEIHYKRNGEWYNENGPCLLCFDIDGELEYTEYM